MKTLYIDAPASKSMSHRNLICAALSHGSSVLTNILCSDDLARTQECLTALGAKFTQEGEKGLGVEGMTTLDCGQNLRDLIVGESGTTCRLMTGVAAAFTGNFRLHGAPRMHERPMRALLTALESLGVSFSYEQRPGFLPLTMHAPGNPHGTVSIDISESSQFLSALLLPAPLSSSPLTIELRGSKVVSWPYVALTLQTMEDFGVTVEVQSFDGRTWTTVDWRKLRTVTPGSIRFTVHPQAYQSGQYRVEADWSNASYFLAAGAVGQEAVCVRGLRPDSMQGDRACLDILQTMGATCVWDSQGCTISPSKLQGARLDMGSCPDIVPTVATIACFAQGTTEIRGVAHLRFKECDRLEGVATQLRKAGQHIEILDDGLKISPQPFAPVAPLPLASFGDHRMVMSLSLLECAGITPAFDDPTCVSKSFPDFWESWELVRTSLAR